MQLNFHPQQNQSFGMSLKISESAQKFLKTKGLNNQEIDKLATLAGNQVKNPFHVHVDFDLRPPKIDLGVRTPINLNMPSIKFTEPKISTLDIKIPNLMVIRLKENPIKLPPISNNFLSIFKRLYNYVRGKIRAKR